MDLSPPVCRVLVWRDPAAAAVRVQAAGGAVVICHRHRPIQRVVGRVPVYAQRVDQVGWPAKAVVVGRRGETQAGGAVISDQGYRLARKGVVGGLLESRGGLLGGGRPLMPGPSVAMS